jgi:DNA-binding XRE family transcriptional regulator
MRQTAFLTQEATANPVHTTRESMLRAERTRMRIDVT